MREPTFNMASQSILVVLFSGFCYSHWIFLPSLSVKHYTLIQNGNNITSKENSMKTELISPYFDIHNLTIMSYGPTFKNKKVLNGWRISLDDLFEFIYIRANIPGTSIGKINFLEHLQKILIVETERQLTNIFDYGDRRARFSHIHYPSMESSLMTISLLLFGVYLTKIIVKILQSQYNKFNLPVGTVNGIRTPIMFAQGRKKRSTELLLQELHLFYIISKNNYKYNKIIHSKNFKLKQYK